MSMPTTCLNMFEQVDIETHQTKVWNLGIRIWSLNSNEHYEI